ncbi:MAG: hypothetical protein M4579_000339 [Chaenotheca gracillima]|nr:MAG: hypothetical protein M4579_000339 [Chaenotheca gracillima]
MSSSVFFKFKSQKEPVRVPFDGTGISVFELKRNIIEINRLGDGTDFDLAIYNEDSNEEYDDDTTIIPRSTSIIARRLPPAKPGRGGAARYVSGKMPVNALNSSRTERPAARTSTQAKPSTSNATAEPNAAQTEEERIAAMFKAGAEQWDQQQQEMAQATPVYRGGGNKGKAPNANVPSHPPPNGYICYRCGEKGHWIQECPTNNDPTFDGRPRVKRTTGIPRSFLKTVEKPAALTGDGVTEGSHQPSGVMVNAEGEFVVAEPDKASWEQYQAKTKVSAAAQEAAKTGSLELQERGLECPIDKKLFVDPAKTPCCAKVFCNDCITNALIENDLTCPSCHSEGILIDDLTADSEVAAKVKSYVEEKEVMKREKERSKSPIDAGSVTSNSLGVPEKPKMDGTVVKSNINSKSPTQHTPIIQSVEKSTDVNVGTLDSKAQDINSTAIPDTASPRGTNRPSTLPPRPTSTNNSNSLKRPATGEPEGQPIPKAPAAMRSQQSSNPSPGPISQRNLPNNPGSFNNAPQNMSMGPSQPFTNGQFQQGMGQMGFQNANGYMGMSMGPMAGMNQSIMNPMMNGFGGNGAAYNDMSNGMGFPQNQNNMYGNQGFPNGGGMMPMNGNNVRPNFNPNFPMQNNMGNGGMMSGGGMMGNNGAGNMNGMMMPGIPMNGGNGVFPNQQRTIFSEPFPSEEDNAYFRKPVNPQRHQARQRRVRPSDYREL